MSDNAIVLSVHAILIGLRILSFGKLTYCVFPFVSTRNSDNKSAFLLVLHDVKISNEATM